MKSIFPSKISLINDCLICEFSESAIVNINFKEVLKIIIETNDKGPFADDIFIQFITNNLKIITPLNESSQLLLESLQKLDNFNNGALIDAMSCAVSSQIVCWKK